MYSKIKNPTPPIDEYSVKNISAKFHPDPIWNDRNDGALGFLKTVAPTRTRRRRRRRSAV